MTKEEVVKKTIATIDNKKVEEQIIKIVKEATKLYELVFRDGMEVGKKIINELEKEEK